MFANDTEHGLLFAATLVNTVGAVEGEKLPDVASLDALVRKWEWTGRRERSQAELDAVRALRPKLRRFWETDEDGVVRLANSLLREGKALPQLVKHDEWGYHVHATPSEAPLATRISVEAAMAFVDLVRSDELARLRICEAEDCDDVVVDLSKNHSKRFCDAGCGNRAAVAAYRARKRNDAKVASSPSKRRAPRSGGVS
jgi:predicted RNA-binding Zn ribbon-like protein